MLARIAGLFQILKKLNDSVYVIDLLKDLSISSTVNVEDLIDYKGSHFNPSESLVDEHELESVFKSPTLPPLSNILPITARKINKILEDEIIATKDGGT